MLVAPATTSTDNRRAAEASLWEAYWADPSPAHRNALVEFYMPFIVNVANVMEHRLPTYSRLDRDDLLSIGAQAMMTAIPRYEPGRATRFTSWVIHRMRGSVLDEIRRGDVPRQTRQLSMLEDKICSLFLALHGFQPTEREIRKGMGLNAKRFARYRTHPAHRFVRLPMLETEAGHERETLADPRPQPQAHLMSQHIMELMRSRPLMFSAREVEIVNLYYFEDLSMRMIGRRFGLSESRVSQMHNLILRRLRAVFTEDELRSN